MPLHPTPDRPTWDKKEEAEAVWGRSPKHRLRCPGGSPTRDLETQLLRTRRFLKTLLQERRETGLPR